MNNRLHPKRLLRDQHFWMILEKKKTVVGLLNVRRLYLRNISLKNKINKKTYEN